MPAGARTTALLGLLGFFWLTLGRASAQDPEAFAVVVHPDSEVVSADYKELERIFSGRIQVWPDGTKIQPVLVKGDLEESFFEVLGVNTSRMEQAWVQLTLQGKGDSPRVVKLSSQAIELVAESPGAIAVVRSDAVDESVKVIDVQPGAPGCSSD